MSEEYNGIEDGLESEPEYRSLGDSGDYLSASRITKYQTCPEAFRRTYVEGKRSPPNARMAEGKTVHSLVELALKIKKSEGRMPLSEEVLDHTNTLFDASFGDVEGVGSTELDKWRTSTQKLYELWHKTIGPSVVPLEIEKRIELPIAGVKVIGFIDLIDGANGKESVIDLKVAKRGKTDRDAKNSLQLGIYSYATKIYDVGFDSLVRDPDKPKDPAIRLARATLSPGDHTWIEEVVDSMANAVVAGVYPKASLDSWLCSEKWCGHWSECRGKHLSLAVPGKED